jgi:hypothetical protein
LGTATPLDLAREIYQEHPLEVQYMGAVQILAHLRWLEEHGVALPGANDAWSRASAV